jgi:ATP-binding cassette subfamily C protein LapB
MIVQPPAPRLAVWLTQPLRENRKTYIEAGLAAVMISCFSLLTSVFTMTVYDRVVPNNAFSSLAVLTLGLGIVIGFDFVLKSLRAYFVDIAGARIDHTVGETLFQRLLAMRLELKRTSTGTLTGLIREIESLREFFTSATLTAVVDVPFIILTLVVIGLIGHSLVLVPIVMIPLVILVGAVTQPALERLSAKTMSEGFQKQSVLVETIGGLEMVKTAGAGPFLRQRWLEAVHRHASLGLQQRLVGSIAINFASAAQLIVYAGVVVMGVFKVADHSLTTGGLVACSMLASRAVAPLGQIANLLSRLTSTQTAYRQINAFMAIPIEGPAREGLKMGALKGAIAFREVNFAYPGAAEPALKAVNFAIAPGERVAIVGPVGSGKSTITRLILGLYPASQGVVTIDGTDLRQMDPASLRRSIGAAGQDNVLLTGSIRENICLGRDGIDDEEMLRVAQVSGTSGFMARTVNGYDLVLADRGEGLSGGQRQSIAIARALAGRPPIVLLDEPSSSIDSDTEARLIQGLIQELQGRTLVVVTHRPAMLALAERVIVMAEGRVVMDGPREAILAKISGPRVA